MRFASFIALAVIAIVGAANARDFGQWSNSDPNIREWFRSLMQPDTYPEPKSCCGEADGYYADVVKYKNDQLIAVITDERDDTPLGRIHEEIGTEYIVPLNKIVIKDGNPTGHVIIFLGGRLWYSQDHYERPVLCYVMNGGV